MSKRMAAGLALATVGVAALLVAGRLGPVRPVAAQTDTSLVVARERFIDGRSEGEVLLGDSVVTRIRSAAGGLTAAQRATTAAQRLDQALRDGKSSPDDVRVAQMNGEYVVMAGDQLIVTADTFHANVNRTTPRQLATAWRDNLARALARPISKICPIISVGSGVRVGLANVTGPAAQVHKAAFVGQLETTFQKVVRIRIFVPIKSKEGVDRVPQVNVNAYGDVKL